MTKPIKSIVIAGGGTAGWITAGTLAAKLKKEAGSDCHVTLVESPNIPAIGVGEGTWPTMRNTLKAMGIRETDFIKACNVSFKQGAKFSQWVTGEKNDFYYHPLVLPQGANELDLVPHWLDKHSNLSFSEAVCPQETLCELGLAPKQIITAEYDAISNYAYHLDAGTFSKFLKNHCIETLGVKHISDDITGVNSEEESGFIESLSTTNSGNITGDLFIDCTGFKSLLLGEHFNIPFKSCKDTLFSDQAIAVQVPYENDNDAIQSHTLSTAQSSGWVWDIGLSNRRGIGHVYSSEHISETQAHDELIQYLKQTVSNPERLNFRGISLNPGHRVKFWEKNCVAVGLSAGFLEPLEASALLLVEISAKMIADQLPPNRRSMKIIADRFNATFLYRWDRIIDFLKLHYMLSQRSDSQFWIDHRASDTIPDSLKEQLELWKYKFPTDNDFEQSLEVFPSASYQYVLYGMGFKTQENPRGLSEQSQLLAQTYFQKNEMKKQQLTSTLQTNRDLLKKIHKYGLQRV